MGLVEAIKELISGLGTEITEAIEGVLSNTEEEGDNVNSPEHYKQGKIEVIEAVEGLLTEEELSGYFVGNIIKYISRYKAKNGIEDLRKAQWYLNRLIGNMEEE